MSIIDTVKTVTLTKIAVLFFVSSVLLAACGDTDNSRSQNQASGSSKGPTDAQTQAEVKSESDVKREAATRIRGGLPSSRDIGRRHIAIPDNARTPEARINLLLHDVVERVEAEHRNMTNLLGRFGFVPGNDFSSDSVSARSLLRHAMQSVEFSNVGDGERLLVRVRDELGRSSVAMQTDPLLQNLRSYTQAEYLREFDWSATLDEASRTPLDPNLDRAISRISELQPTGFELKKLVRRHFAPGLALHEIDALLQRSPSRRDFLLRTVGLLPPPPSEVEKVRALTTDFQNKTVARQIDPNLIGALDALEDNLPSRYDQMLKPSNNVPTYNAQYAELRRAGGTAGVPDNVMRALDNAAVGGDIAGRLLSSPITAPTSGYGGGSSVHRGTARFASQAYAQAARSSFVRFTRETFGGPNGLSRSFRIAARSIRGPGGISFGAEFDAPGDAVPVAVQWLEKPGHPQFGHFLFTLKNAMDEASYALSVPLHVESAAVAWIAIFNPVDRRSTYDESEIFPVVTIDRFSEQSLPDNTKPVAINPALHGYNLAWSVARADFWFSAGRAATNDIRALFGDSAMNSEPTDSWQVVQRLATWQFHDRKHFINLFDAEDERGPGRIQVCNIASCAYTGEAVPHMTISPFAAEDITALQVLQFALAAAAEECNIDQTKACFEREIKSTLAQLALSSSSSGQDATYITRLIAEIDQSPSMETWVERRLGTDPGPRVEWVEDLQPLIDWLTRYHPDFIRLNDFSEAFTLMRWARSAGLNAGSVVGPTYEQAPAALPPPNAVQLNEEIVTARILNE